jgi:hypothetical protein
LDDDRLGKTLMIQSGYNYLGIPLPLFVCPFDEPIVGDYWQQISHFTACQIFKLSFLPFGRKGNYLIL